VDTAQRRETEKKEFEESILQIDRVTKVVKGGKILRFRVVIIIGDRKGRVGIGVGKAREIPAAIVKGVSDAKRNIVNIRIKNNTIPARITVRRNTATVFLAPAVPGTGIVAGRAVRMIAEKAGIQDLLSKSMGSSNPLNIATATIEAFKELQAVIERSEMRKAAVLGGKDEA